MDDKGFKGQLASLCCREAASLGRGRVLVIGTLNVIISLTLFDVMTVHLDTPLKY